MKKYSSDLYILKKVFTLSLLFCLLIFGQAHSEQLSIAPSPLDSDGDGVPDETDLDDDNDGILDTDEDLDKNASWDFETPVVGPGNNFFGAEFRNWTLSAGGRQINLIRPPYANAVPQVPSRGEQYVEISGDATFSRPYTITKATPITVQIDFSPWAIKREETRIQIYAADGSTVLAESDIIVTEADDNTNWSDRDEIWQTASLTTFLEPGDYFFRFRLGNFQAFDNVRVSTQSSADDDLDGIPNSLDTDSDNDGCPDAMEGSASFTWFDLNESMLTGQVDANGTPTAVGSEGQNQGLSADSTVSDPSCDDPKPEPEPEPITINFAQASHVSIYDDGDGIADSLWMDFDKSLNQLNRFDSVWVIWGGDTSVYKWKDFNKSQDKRSVYLSNQSFSEGIYTGGQQNLSKQQVLLFYSDTADVNQQVIVEEHSLKDRVGPVIVNATLVKGDIQTLFVKYSEEVSYEFDGGVSEEIVYQFQDELDELQNRPISEFTLLSNTMSSEAKQSENLIQVRDSIRLHPKKGILDLEGNRPHPDNIFRKLNVETQVKVEKSNYAFVHTVNEFGEKIKNDQFVIYPLEDETPVEDIPSLVNAIGVKFTLDLATEFQDVEDFDESLIRVRWQMEVFTNLGGFVGKEIGSIDCFDPVFENGCLEGKTAIYPGWNMRDNSGRLAGSGAYIMRVRLKVMYNGQEHSENEDMWLVGVRR